jgi:hypothetical protein
LFKLLFLTFKNHRFFLPDFSRIVFDQKNVKNECCRFRARIEKFRLISVQASHRDRCMNVSYGLYETKQQQAFHAAADSHASSG